MIIPICCKHITFMKFLASVLLVLSACATGRSVEQGPLLRVAVQKDPLQVLEIPLEKYLLGVLSKEVHADWPIEALKAQAVASRTFALYRKEGRPEGTEYDLESTTRDQVFQEQRRYPEILVRAVEETRGEILKSGDLILPAFFHSSCGGISEKAEYLWPGVTAAPVNAIHEDPFCEESPRSRWDYELTRDQLGGTLQILERDETGRVETLLIQSETGDQELSGNGFRERFGYDKIRSTLFDIEEKGDRILIQGRGSGHGVGLCQWGAKGMAEQGYSYREILEFYYPGAELGHLAF